MVRDTKLLRRALAVLWLLAVALAQGAPQGSQGQAVPQSTLQGTVRGNGGALKGAVVTLQRADSPGSSNSASRSSGGSGSDTMTAATDNTGQFLFNHVAPGDYRVSADHPGFLHQEYGQRVYSGPGTIVTVAAGQGAANVDFDLLSMGSISGRILDEDRMPVAGVRVEALSYTYHHGKRTLTTTGEDSQTDDRGAYRVYWLTPGNYFVRAMPPSGSAVSVGQPTHDSYPPTYFPGQLNPEEATPVSITPAAEVGGIDFAILPVPTVTVSGRLLLPQAIAIEGLPASGAPRHPGPEAPKAAAAQRGSVVSVSLVPVGSASNLTEGNNRTSARADGSFEIARVVPGSYYLLAQAPASGQQYYARMRLEVGQSGVSGVTMPLQPGIQVTGKISSDGRPPSGFKMSRLRVSLTSDDFGGAGGRLGKVAEDGTFAVPDLPPAELRVRIGGLPQGAYLKAGRIGSGDALEQPFVASANDSLQLSIGFDAGEVQGRVVDADGKPVSGVLAVLAPDSNHRRRYDLFFSTETDDSGHVDFPGVPPGSYRLFAWEDVPDGAWQDPDFIRQYEERGKPVEVDAGRSASEDVSLIPRGN